MNAAEPLPEGFNPHGPVAQVAQTVLDTLRRRHRYDVVGVEHLPLSGPCLLVVNHSLATYDILLLGQTLLERTGRLPRGLGDKRLFQLPVLRQLVSYFGGVKASHDAADQLLLDGRVVLVAPGGMLEALRPSEQRYQVAWADRKGFVELAVRTGCPLVLAACPHADDLYDVDDSEVTRSFYQKWHVPLPFLRGEGGGLLPRAVRLTHHLSEPIHPPQIPDREDPGPYIEALHTQVLERMAELMTTALAWEASQPSPG